jgi:class 3 adenylate cyclase
MLYISGVVSLLTYLYYLNHITGMRPEFDPNGNMFVYYGAYEIGVVVALWIVWSMAVFFRTIRYLEQNVDEDSGAELRMAKQRISAVRKIVVILLSPVALLAAIILAYQGLASWATVSHLLGSGLTLVLYLFAVIYLNNAPESSSLQIRMVGLFLGAMVILLGVSALIATHLHENSFLSLKELEVERSVELLQKDDLSTLPSDVMYVRAEGEQLFSRTTDQGLARVRTTVWRNGWSFVHYSEEDPNGFFIEKAIKANDRNYRVGYSYLRYRQHMDDISRSLAYLIVTAALLVVFLLPLFFRLSLFVPLQRLLDGVGRLQEGDLNRAVPVTAQDEVGTLTTAFNRMTRSIRESRDQLRTAYEQQIDLTDAYSRFVPKQILTTLNKASILELGLGDNVQKNMTIMFSDMRSFTTLSESLTPQEVFEYINNYLQQVGPIVRQHQGYIDKFIGDAIMALFPRSAESAIQTAMEMQREVARLNQRLVDEQKFSLEIGVGIHTGPMMLGTIGEEERMEGTVISDVVNAASRIEGLTKLYDTPILISSTTFEQISGRDRYQFRKLDRVRVKGKQQWLDIVEVLDGENEQRYRQKIETRADFEAAVEAFQNRRFEQAKQRFESLKERAPNDRALDIYLERCDRFIEMGIPEDWDGSVML